MHWPRFQIQKCYAHGIVFIWISIIICTSKYYVSIDRLFALSAERQNKKHLKTFGKSYNWRAEEKQKIQTHQMCEVWVMDVEMCMHTLTSDTSRNKERKWMNYQILFFRFDSKPNELKTPQPDGITSTKKKHWYHKGPLKTPNEPTDKWKRMKQWMNEKQLKYNQQVKYNNSKGTSDWWKISRWHGME